MDARPTFPLAPLLVNGAVAGLVAGSAAAALTAFEIAVRLLDENWARVVEDAGPVFALATPVGVVGGILWGLLVATVCRPSARIGDPRVRRAIFVAAFTSGFAVLAIGSFAMGMPPWRPLAALVVVAVALACAWSAFSGLDRRRVDSAS